MPVTVMDVRALPSLVDGLTFVQSDASNLKHFGSSGLESVSSLHAIEHFGLGRYGDPVNPDAPFEAMRALVSVLGPGGILYLAVPIGVERLEFNAHRVFAPSTILQALAGLRLVSFSAIDDEGHYHEDVSPDAFVQMWYACGLFEFTK
jgi:SAM-dependent methyltransferase